MERLSGLDSAFLAMETPTMHLHVAITAVVDPTTMTAPYSFTQLRSFIAGRLLAHPAFRRRVVEVPFGLNHALWVEDPDLDLDSHISRHVLPAPGEARELADLTAAIVGVPLDRSRPLWEIHVVEGLHDGNVALVGKIHHAAVDGVSGAELFIHLFDLTPAPAEQPTVGADGGLHVDNGSTGSGSADSGTVTGPTPMAPDRIPSDIELVGRRRDMLLVDLFGPDRSDLVLSRLDQPRQHVTPERVGAEREAEERNDAHDERQNPPPFLSSKQAVAGQERRK